MLLSLEETIAKGSAQWGVRWPNPWWPGGNNSYDDCAKFAGWLLGMDTYLVSDIQLRRGFEFHDGAAGVRRGDIVGWNWDGYSPGNYDHTGVCTRVVGSTVFTLDANAGPGDCVGEYGRSASFITSYVRPAYPGFAADTITPLNNTQEDTMHYLEVSDAENPKNATRPPLLISGGFEYAVTPNNGAQRSRAIQTCKDAGGVLYIGKSPEDYDQKRLELAPGTVATNSILAALKK